MLPRLKFLLLTILAISLMSAVPVGPGRMSVASLNTGDQAPASVVKPVKKHRLNFLKRAALKIYLKMQARKANANADNLAKTSLTLGIVACGLIVLGLFVPYIILGAVPAGIAAMITGGSALRNNTAEVGKAKTGKALGLGALIAFGVILIAAAIIISGAYWW